MSFRQPSITGTWSRPAKPKKKKKKTEFFECSDAEITAVAESASEAYIEETFGEEAEKLEEFFKVGDIRSAFLAGFYAARFLQKNGEIELELDEDEVEGLSRALGKYGTFDVIRE